MARSLLSTTTRVGDINPVAGSIYDAGSYQDTTSMKIGKRLSNAPFMGLTPAYTPYSSPCPRELAVATKRNNG